MRELLGVIEVYHTLIGIASLGGRYTDEYISYYTLKLEKAMAPHSSTLAWKILWTEEPGRLQSMGSLRVGHD